MTAGHSVPGPEGFASATLLTITRDRLAVRQGPATSAPIALAGRWDAALFKWVSTGDDVRLPTGYEVLVGLGPIANDGYTWHRVTNSPGCSAAATAQVEWDTDRDGQFCDDGWVAVAGPDGPFVTAQPHLARPDDNPPLVFDAGSAEAFTSAAFSAEGVLVGEWYLASSEDRCRLSISVEPAAGVLLDQTNSERLEGGRLESSALRRGDYQLHVEASGGGQQPTCGWAVALYRGQ